MPVPIIERQKALTIIGEIRTGDEMRTNPKTGKPLVGKKLETFRLTSQHRELLDAAAEKWGGEVKEWESQKGAAWQLVTEKSAIPCAILVGYSLDLIYELWEGATKCTRRCDGKREEVGGTECVCNLTGVDQCDIITRLTVILPGLGTTLGWRLRSTGENAARELAGAMELADGIANGRSFVPAVLRLTQRRGISDGQVVRYVVPVLDLRLQSALELEAPTERPALNSGGVTDGLGELERRAAAPKHQTLRSAAPIGSPSPIPPTTSVAAAPESTPVGAQVPLPVPEALNAQSVIEPQSFKAPGHGAEEELLYACAEMEINLDDVRKALADHAGDDEWLQRQVVRVREQLALRQLHELEGAK